MDRSFTFDITQDRYNRVKKIVQNNSNLTVSSFINNSVDFYIEHLETKYLSDIMYYLGFPFLAFIGFIGLTLYLKSLFFYILTAIVAIYLIILCYLFYYRYRTVKKKICLKE